MGGLGATDLHRISGSGPERQAGVRVGVLEPMEGSEARMQFGKSSLFSPPTIFRRELSQAGRLVQSPGRLALIEKEAETLRAGRSHRTLNGLVNETNGDASFLVRTNRRRTCDSGPMGRRRGAGRRQGVGARGRLARQLLRDPGVPRGLSCLADSLLSPLHHGFPEASDQLRARARQTTALGKIPPVRLGVRSD